MICFIPGFLGWGTLQNQQSDHWMCGFNPPHVLDVCFGIIIHLFHQPTTGDISVEMAGKYGVVRQASTSFKKPNQTPERRYAFQHPQRAGDIAKLLPSSFILRNPRDCKDFQRQAGYPAIRHVWHWKIAWKSPALFKGNCIYERSDLLITLVGGYWQLGFFCESCLKGPFLWCLFMLKLIDIQVHRCTEMS